MTSVKTILKAGYGDKKSQRILKPLKDNELSNRNNQVYYDKTKNQVIQNIKGTNPFSPQDIYTDAVLGIYGSKGLRNTSRFKESQKIFQQAKEKYPDTKMTVVGHSLGKNLGELVADKQRDKFVGVNGFYHPFKPTSTHGGNFQHFRTSNDIVSVFGSNSTNVKTGSFKNPFDILGNHSVNAIPDKIFV